MVMSAIVTQGVGVLVVHIGVYKSAIPEVAVNTNKLTSTPRLITSAASTHPHDIQKAETYEVLLEYNLPWPMGKDGTATDGIAGTPTSTRLHKYFHL